MKAHIALVPMDTVINVKKVVIIAFAISDLVYYNQVIRQAFVEICRILHLQRALERIRLRTETEKN